MEIIGDITHPMNFTTRLLLTNSLLARPPDGHRPEKPTGARN
jgi:hypothetical protein